MSKNPREMSPILGPVYQLARSELAISKFFLEMRDRSCETAGSDMRLQAEGDAYRRRLASIWGEVAFSRLFNLAMDWTTRPRSGGHDFVWDKGEKRFLIDVKTSLSPWADLCVTVGKRAKPCDVYVLAVVRGEGMIEIAGQATAAEVFHDDRMMPPPAPGKDPYFRIPRSELRPLPTRRSS